MTPCKYFQQKDWYIYHAVHQITVACTRACVLLLHVPSGKWYQHLVHLQCLSMTFVARSTRSYLFSTPTLKEFNFIANGTYYRKYYLKYPGNVLRNDPKKPFTQVFLYKNIMWTKCDSNWKPNFFISSLQWSDILPSSNQLKTKWPIGPIWLTHVWDVTSVPTGMLIKCIRNATILEVGICLISVWPVLLSPLIKASQCRWSP